MGQEKQALLHAISAYVPALVARRAIAAPRASTAWQEEWLTAALLFADVSGFTAMSERLARLGKQGAEELTRILNAYFTAMIDLVHSYGGQVIKFGGDALTCAFANPRVGKWQPKTAPSLQVYDLQAEVLRACACALAMQERMSRFASLHSGIAAFQAVQTMDQPFELRMKIGISAGSVLSVTVGEPREGLEYVLAGRTLDRMALAEHHAAAGEVLVDRACLAGPGGSWEKLGIVVGQQREGFLPLMGLAQPVEQAVVDNVRSEAPSLEASIRETLDDTAAERAISRLAPYLPPTVYEQIVEGQLQFMGEHRRVVSLFVNFLGLDYDGDLKAGWKLQRYFTAMQEIIHRYGGRLNRVITGDKGSLLHLIFGAPVAHEDDEKRALGCALELQHCALSSETLPFITDQRIGIASGYVFAGAVGSQRRREYTVMGDVVNLSARLMQLAGSGEILLDRHTAHNAFVCDELPPVRVKGKQQPIPVCRLVGVRAETKVWTSTQSRPVRRGPPIVGRERELAQIEEVIDHVTQGHGQLLVISGEAGTGKSRLLEELIALAYEKSPGMAGLGGDCLAYGSQSPYLPWIDVFTAFFELNAEGEGGQADLHDRTAQRLDRIGQRMIEADPALGDWAPLMAQMMGLPLPDNELTASLDAQLRKQRTFDIALALLRHQAQQVPLLLIVFEDVHWIDAISLELLNYIARNLAGHRILLVALHRPTIQLPEWARQDHYNRIELVDLPAEDALKLIRCRLGMAQVPAPLRECVLRGEQRVNPFFTEEVLASLIDRGYLVPKHDGDPFSLEGHSDGTPPSLEGHSDGTPSSLEGHSDGTPSSLKGHSDGTPSSLKGHSDGTGYNLRGDLSEVEIPDSVQALVMSRIDRLDESARLTIKVASVIGRTFQYRTLLGIYPVEITPERLRRNLERLSRLDLTPLDRPAPEWSYIFKHVTTQEVAYENLLYAHRRELHHRVGEYLEQVHAGGLQEVIELLAHHFYLSGDREKSWGYLIQAGDKAKARYANLAAIAYYDQALSQKGSGEATEDTAQTCESLGDVCRLVGQYDKALHSYRSALERQPPSTAQAAEVWRKIAKTLELQGCYDEAARHLDVAREALGDRPPTPELARIYSDTGWVAMRRGDYAGALQAVTAGLDVAGRLPQDDRCHRVTARLQHTLGSIYWRKNDYPQAIAHFQACIQVQESARALHRLSGSYNNLAAVYWSQGDYNSAADYIRKSLEIHRRIGNTYGTAMCYNNLGVIAYTLGDCRRAIDSYEQSLEIRREIGDVKGVADVYNNLGEVHHSLGNCQQALHYLEEAVAISIDIGDKTGLTDTYKLLAEVALEMQDVSQAEEYCQCSLRTAREIGNREYEGIAYRVLGHIHRLAGRPAEAEQHLRESVETLTPTGNRLELGRSTSELGLTLVAMGSPEGRQHLQQAIHIFEELGLDSEMDEARAALANP